MDVDVKVKKVFDDSNDEKKEEMEIKKRLLQEKEREIERANAVHKQKVCLHIPHLLL